VIKPVALPPAIKVPVFAGIFNPGFIKKEADVVMRKIPRTSFRTCCGRTPISSAPTRLNRMLGTPN
jgi:hypothetical protein